MPERICTGCSVIFADQEAKSSFCSDLCESEYDFSYAHASRVWKELDAGFYGAFDSHNGPMGVFADFEGCDSGIDTKA